MSEDNTRISWLAAGTMADVVLVIAAVQSKWILAVAMGALAALCAMTVLWP